MDNLDAYDVPDALWEKVEPLIPEKARDPDRQYKRAPGAGRKKEYSDRLYFSAIVHVLRTGIIWNALPGEKFGGITSQAVHKKYLEWSGGGLFRALWDAGIAECDGMQGIAWEWRPAEGGGREWMLAVERRNRGRRARKPADLSGQDEQG